MNRCTIIDKLDDDYGIKPENLTEREKAIIGLCTNKFLENEEQALIISNVVGQSEQFTCECGFTTDDSFKWGVHPLICSLFKD